MPKTKGAGRSSRRIPLAPMPVAAYGRVFSAGDLHDLAEEVGLPLLPGANPEELRERLGRMAEEFCLGIVATAKSSAGDSAEWAGGVAERARALLALFETEGVSWGPDDRSEQAARVLRQAAVPLLEAGLPVPTPGDVQAALQAIEALAQQMRIASEWFEARKGQRRQPPVLELHFVRQIGGVFRDAFGADLAVSTGKPGSANEGIRGGPGIRFLQGVVERLRERVPALDIERDQALWTALDRLSEPGSAAERIRDLNSGGLLRKR